MTTKQIGTITELQCATEFLKLGIDVSIPYGDGSRYDCIIDVNKKLYKIQIKHARPINNEGFMFTCKSCNLIKGHRTNKRYSSEDVDFFATYFNDKCYLIPINECGTEKRLRFKQPVNNNSTNIYWAKDYELEIQINKLKTCNFKEKSIRKS